ncbi:MAG: hypothetical protein CSB34_06565 [Desulfobulbus propionicus]|nr:MAG: hypothetical protein CSB34_06565 [Desulfobulbus propionicus]
MNAIRYLPHIGSFILTVFLVPEAAWALQSHGAPEGLYVHQMSHLLFAGALVYLYMHTRCTPELEGKGWKYLQLFCILFAGWNMLALVGHEVIKLLSVEDFINKSTWNEQIAGPVTPIKLLYFITKMDHLIYVPALFSLVMSLRTFSNEVLKEEQN